MSTPMYNMTDMFTENTYLAVFFNILGGPVPPSIFVKKESLSTSSTIFTIISFREKFSIFLLLMRIPAYFLRHISEESPEKATLKCLSGGIWNVKLRYDEDGLLIHNGWDKFQKNNQLEDGEFLVFRYNGGLQFTVRIFTKNGLEREVKSTATGKNQQASVYDRGSKHKRPAKYPFSSKFPEQTRANGENSTERETPRKRAAVDKAEEGLLTPNIRRFVKCLKGYNVNKSCFLYVPKSFYEQLMKSDNKTTVVLRNSEEKEWKVNCIGRKGYRAFCGGWRQFVSGNKLKEGYVCVFQLVNANELKVSVFDNPSESLLKLAAER